MTEVTAGWGEFYVAEVGAAAALAGFVIVAISINLQRILSVPVLPGRAAETIITLFGALLIASVGLIPHQPIKLLGAEILGIGLAGWLFVMTLQLRTFAVVKDQPARWWVPRMAISFTAALPIVVSGVLLVFGMPEGLYWTAAGILISLAASVFNAWVLLVEILR